MRSILLILILIMLCLLVLIWKNPQNRSQWSQDQILYPDLPVQFDDDLSKKSLLQALGQSLRYYKKLPAAELIQFGPNTYTARRMARSLAHFKEEVVNNWESEDFFDYLARNFTFLKNREHSVLFTGYFEARLEGSYKRSKKFRYPLYRKPHNLVTVNLEKFPVLKKREGNPETISGRLRGDRSLIPYYSREDIDYNKKLAGQNLELVWVSDPVDAFFLHLQGSGVISLPNGKRLRINYAASNGLTYRSIGRYMTHKKFLSKEEVSMQSIKKYLQKHPEVQHDVFSYNPRYIFFRTVKEGPLGNLEVPLTPYRSIATDSKLFPPGALAIITTLKPVVNKSNKITAWKKFSRFVFNQDTGAAIRGPGRVDLFTGVGKESEFLAGHMSARGEITFLAPRN